MLFTLATMLTGLSADVKRNSYLESFRSSDWGFPSEQVEYSYEPFMLCNSIVNKSVSSLTNLDYESLSIDVRRNSINIIERLSTIFIDNISDDNLYPSSYGTFIIEFEKNNSIFSLEVGKNSIGYFSEINGNTVHFQEEINIENFEELDLIVGDLNKVFFDFYSKI